MSKKPKPECEGMVRHGGLFTIGRPYWTQCKEPATVMLTVEQTSGGWGHEGGKGTFPVCNECWKRAEKTDDIKVLEVKPI